MEPRCSPARLLKCMDHNLDTTNPRCNEPIDKILTSPLASLVRQALYFDPPSPDIDARLAIS